MGPNAGGPEGLVGRVIGGYQLERIIGDGGTGVVYLGRRARSDVHLPERAAIKVLKLFWFVGGQQRDELRARFEREVETWQRLQHPHILPVIAAGDEYGLPYIVLQYADGGTLAGRLASSLRGLPLTQAATYLTQLADALDYAHSQGVIHRDIKPGNVLLDGSDNAYLTDFSIAKVIEGTQLTLTGTGVTLGTPAYMAPEQGQRDVQPGPEVDVYSLGVLLYEMVTGQVPFRGADPVDVLHSHRHELPPPPRRLRPELPAAAEAAILKALAKRPEDRLRTAGALARAFSAGLQGAYTEGVAPDPLSTAPTLRDVAPPQTIDARAPQTVMTRQASTPRAVALTGLAAVLIVSALAVVLSRGGSPSASGKQYTIYVLPPTTTPYPPTITVGPGTPTPTPYPPTATPNLTPIPLVVTATSTSAQRPTQTPTPTTVPASTPTPSPTPTPAPPVITQTDRATGGNQPAGIARDNNGCLWIANYNSNSVTGLCSSNGYNVTYALSNVCSFPFGVAFDTRLIWISCFGASKLIAIDPNSQTVTSSSIATPANPYNLYYYNGKLWVNTWYSNVQAYDPNSGSLLCTVSAKTDYGELAFANGIGYVGDDASGTIQRFNTSNCSSAGSSISLGFAADRGITICGGKLWAAFEVGNKVATYDLTTGAVSSYNIGNYPTSLGCDNSYVWVANYNVYQMIQVALDGSVVHAFNASGYTNRIYYDGSSIWITQNTAPGIVSQFSR